MSIEVKSPMTGSAWKVLVTVGQEVEEDQEVIILESMKMEIPILAPEDGIIKEVHIAEGNSVSEGDVVVVMEEL
ncbi:biotin/lipoyl-containing protein [Solibacillus sp. FSL W8-0474]|uniref:biotin/lipoyl-containing protein n=1 Tax=Solibacillus sp. FSL W8-0474 TaxID=2975336 RepID=UPI0030F4B48E